jgi:hypothetical protein
LNIGGRWQTCCLFIDSRNITNDNIIAPCTNQFSVLEMKFSMLYGTVDIIFSTRNELLEAGNEKEKHFVCELFIVHCFWNWTFFIS